MTDTEKLDRLIETAFGFLTPEKADAVSRPYAEAVLRGRFANILNTRPPDTAMREALMEIANIKPILLSTIYQPIYETDWNLWNRAREIARTALASAASPPVLRTYEEFIANPDEPRFPEVDDKAAALAQAELDALEEHPILHPRCRRKEPPPVASAQVTERDTLERICEICSATGRSVSADTDERTLDLEDRLNDILRIAAGALKSSASLPEKASDGWVKVDEANPVPDATFARRVLPPPILKARHNRRGVSMGEQLPTIAICDRCGRGFVWVNRTGDMVDHFSRQGEECGGNIVMTSPSPPAEPDGDAK